MKQHLGRWARRYLPGEVTGTVTALAAAALARSLGHDLVVVALAATLGENIGFYGYNVTREAIFHLRSQEALYGHHRYVLAAWHSARSVGLEFGSAELVDGLLLRPLCMYAVPQWVGNFAVGIVVAKLAADVGFYAVAIGAFELHKKLRAKPAAAKVEP